MKTDQQVKRKVLFSAMFDVGTMDFEAAIVTAYHYLHDDTVNFNVKSGFVSLQQYQKNIPLKKIKLLNTKKKIAENCRAAIAEVIPTYSGKKRMTDFYYSKHMAAVHSLLGVINVENEPDPE